MAARRGRPRGGLEHHVLTCLVSGGGHRPLSPAEVLAELEGGLAPHSGDDHAVAAARQGRAVACHRGRRYVYQLPIALDEVPASVSAHRMRRILEDGEDRSGIFARFVSDLSPEDAQVLRRLLSDGKTPAKPCLGI